MKKGFASDSGSSSSRGTHDSNGAVGTSDRRSGCGGTDSGHCSYDGSSNKGEEISNKEMDKDKKVIAPPTHSHWNNLY